MLPIPPFSGNQEPTIDVGAPQLDLSPSGFSNERFGGMFHPLKLRSLFGIHGMKCINFQPDLCRYSFTTHGSYGFFLIHILVKGQILFVIGRRVACGGYQNSDCVQFARIMQNVTSDSNISKNKTASSARAIFES